ncbi:zinc transporter ztp29-like [Nannochloropsis oceanica]
MLFRERPAHLLHSQPNSPDPTSAEDLSIISSLPLALFLTTLSGLATVLGALIVCLEPNGMTGRRLGLAQGMAAGFMIAVTLLEIIPEALEGIQVWQCISLAGMGAASISMVKLLLPEPDLSAFWEADWIKARNGGKGLEMVEKRRGGNGRNRNNSSGNNGSNINEQHSRREPSSDTTAAAATADEDGFFSLNDSGTTEPFASLPSSSLTTTSPSFTHLERQRRNSLLWSGLQVALSLSLHNFPEGIATFAASLKGLNLGLPLAISIALHNLPEGAACAIPIYVATGSRKKALLVALLSGLAEPAGVLFVAFVGPSSLTPAVVAGLLSVVGGVMIRLSVFELAPQAVEFASKREAVFAGGVGFLVMSFVLGVMHV